MLHLDIFNSIKEKEANIKNIKKAIFNDLNELTKDFGEYYYCNTHHMLTDHEWFSINFVIPYKHENLSTFTISLNIQNKIIGKVEKSLVNVLLRNTPLAPEYKILHMYGDDVKNNFVELGIFTKVDFPYFVNKTKNFYKQNSEEILFTDFMKKSFEKIILPYLKEIKIDRFKATDKPILLEKVIIKFELIIKSLETENNLIGVDNDSIQLGLNCIKHHEIKKMHHDLNISLKHKSGITKNKL